MSKLSLKKALKLFERDHRDCDSNTCSMSVAFKHGYVLHALDCWVGSGAASEEFYGVELPFTFEEAQAEAIHLINEVEHIECKCESIIWEPQLCDGHCDNCGVKNNYKKERVS